MVFYVFSFTSHCLIVVPWWFIITHLVSYFLVTFGDLLSKKKHHSHWSPRPPNDAPRERITRSLCVETVEITNRKTTSPTFSPTQSILHISFNNHLPKQRLHISHLPIIKVSWKVRTPTTQLPTLLPSIWHPPLFVYNQEK